MRATRLRLRDGVSVGEAPDGLADAFRMLAGEGATEDELADLVLAGPGRSALSRLYYELGRLGDAGLLRYSVRDGGETILAVEPARRAFRPREAAAEDGRYRLSRFAVLRREEDALVLESPLAAARALLGPKGALLAACLARPSSLAELGAATGLGADAAGDTLRLLTTAGLVALVDEHGALEEDGDPVLSQWEPHDLLFHSRSRLGSADGPIGGTFRFLGVLPPLPALKPASSGSAIPLDRPEVSDEVPFTRVLEERRSVRRYGARPITKRQLGEFLHRTARVRELHEANPEKGLHYQATSRPYPSAGAAYELEIYAAVGACDGLEPGLYHYDPAAHALEPLSAEPAFLRALLDDARAAADLASDPQVLLTLAARFPRLSWKYSGIAYALTLKNVGALFQTMYLVATAMGLAPCALGCGNSLVFARAAGADRFAEPSVGEFLLGSAPE
jgi:SagB-type dehydrogenase family enzyme